MRTSLDPRWTGAGVAALFSLLLSLCTVTLVQSGWAADASRPHPHQGLVPPFEGRPPSVTLDRAQKAQLAAGDAVLTTMEDDVGGRGIAIQDVEAPPSVIWNRIGAFREYPRMVDRVEECEPYLEDGHDVRVRFLLEALGFEYEYYIKHDFRPGEGYVTWTLDYTRESDLDESVGYWAVVPHPDDPARSRIFYSIDVRTRGWMPGFVRKMVSDSGLRSATAWIKLESEALQKQLAEASP